MKFLKTTYWVWKLRYNKKKYKKVLDLLKIVETFQYNFSNFEKRKELLQSYKNECAIYQNNIRLCNEKLSMLKS